MGVSTVRSSTKCRTLEGISGYCKGSGACLKGQTGLGKKESEVILRKFGSFCVRSYKLGQVPYESPRVHMRPPSSPTRFLTNIYKILPQLPVVIAESHSNVSGLISKFYVHAEIGRQRTRTKRMRTGEGFLKKLSFQALKKGACVGEGGERERA